jgi:uncharacterized protein with von Willebrand factor type A (vWA) domain
MGTDQPHHESVCGVAGGGSAAAVRGQNLYAGGRSMIRTRYTQWDGTQRVRLDADRVFEKLSEYLSYTDDVQQAFDWLLQQGAEWEGTQVRGLDDLLESLREHLRDNYRQFNLDGALDGMRQRLEELVDLEREALEQRPPDDAGVEEKGNFLDRLPHGLSEAMARLQDYEFEDDDARRELENLLEELQNIQDLEDFQKRYGDLFHGPRSLGYDEALELMRQIQRMKQLEEQFLSGQLSQVNIDILRDILGAPAVQDLQNLQQMMMLLEQSGYLATQGDNMRLSPKGVRRIGQLALRDIYQGLLRDRPGAHHADQRGLAEVRPDATRPYRYGDPMHLDLVGTLKKALGRRAGAPLELRPDDFEVYDTNLATSTSTVLLLDMSWSMSWEGRFAAAKKVAIALESLIRTKFPRDDFSIVGFFTRAVELDIKDLPQASWNMGDPFTNLQDGLRLAADVLARRRSRNKHIIVITRLFLGRPAVLRVAALVRRHQLAGRAGDAEGGGACHPQRDHDQHLHARRQSELARLRRAHDAHQQGTGPVHPARPPG